MPREMLTQLLVLAERARAAGDAARDARDDFARLVADADRAGLSTRDISVATGYSQSRIHQLMLRGADEIDADRD